MKRKFVYSLTAMAAATVMTFGVFSLAACGDKLHTHIDEDGNGKCDICGAAMGNQGGNDPVDDPNNGGNTAVIVGGVLIGATALIVAGTVVGAILIVRKKRKNVI